MVRLFSKFPGQIPGIGLFLLRVAVLVTLFVPCRQFLGASHIMALGMALVALAILLGFLTRLVAAVSCLFQVACFLSSGHADVTVGLASILNPLVLALLGPGAYSLDSRLFGFREIVFPPNDRPRYR
jgi:uncharacterized membrane protein YphA (DoxX/SURF4 family)